MDDKVLAEQVHRVDIADNNDENQVNNDHSTANEDRNQESSKKSSRKRKTKKQSSLKDDALHQQRLMAYQPVLTPQRAIPFLIFLGLVFIPLGIVFLFASNSVVEYVLDYTDCTSEAPISDTFAQSRGQFEWRRDPSDPLTCVIRLRTTSRKAMGRPVFLYYQLTNFYQNNRLYAKSFNYEQLMGRPLKRDELRDCEPLVGPVNDKDGVYYPCGLIANSWFSDDIQVEGYDFAPFDIAYPYDRKMYSKSEYDLAKVNVYPPPNWDKEALGLSVDKKTGKYTKLPDLHKDQRFMNWMRLSGLSTFRKLYGKYDGQIAEQSTLLIRVRDRYDTRAYSGRKAVVLSTASWMGGKNRFLGYAYVMFGTFLIIIGMVFLAKHLLSPRPLADARYLSWSREDTD